MLGGALSFLLLVLPAIKGHLFPVFEPALIQSNEKSLYQVLNNKGAATSQNAYKSARETGREAEISATLGALTPRLGMRLKSFA